jgi:hypothetical protein
MGSPGLIDPRLPWERQPLSEMQTVFARSYARHLLRKYQAQRVTLYLIEHMFPSPQEVLDGLKLDDPRFYRTRKLGSFDADAIDKAAEQVLNWRATTAPGSRPLPEARR